MNIITRLFDRLIGHRRPARFADPERQLRFENRPPEAEDWEPNICFQSPWEIINEDLEISYAIGHSDEGWWYASQSCNPAGEYEPVWEGPFDTKDEAFGQAESWRESQHAMVYADWRHQGVQQHVLA